MFALIKNAFPISQIKFKMIVFPSSTYRNVDEINIQLKENFLIVLLHPLFLTSNISNENYYCYLACNTCRTLWMWKRQSIEMWYRC